MTDKKQNDKLALSIKWTYNFRKETMKMSRDTRAFRGKVIEEYGTVGKFAEAKEFFALERQAYPYSVLYAGFELAALELSHASASERAEAKARLIRNLELRDIPLSEVNRFHRDAALDDAPIPWGKLK